MILEFIETCDDTDYWITSDGTPYTTMNPDIEQHLIVARVKFQRIS